MFGDQDTQRYFHRRIVDELHDVRVELAQMRHERDAYKDAYDQLCQDRDQETR